MGNKIHFWRNSDNYLNHSRGFYSSRLTLKMGVSIGGDRTSLSKVYYIGLRQETQTNSATTILWQLYCGGIMAIGIDDRIA